MPVVRATPQVVSLSDNQEITISWEHTPGHRLDWIAFYEEGTVDMMAFVGKFFTGAKFSGEFCVSLEDSTIFTQSLSPGRYLVRLLRNEEIVVLAQCAFTVL